MKIFFEDGKLDSSMPRRWIFIDAMDGVSMVKKMLYFCSCLEPVAEIYTNSILAFDNNYAWNCKLGVPEIYIRHKGNFARIDSLTTRELKRGHNLMKLYLGGEFSSGS